MLTLKLPVPPSVNAAFVNRKSGEGHGRIKSAAYKTWLKEADGFYYEQSLSKVRAVEGPYRVSIFLHYGLRGDVDNRIKLVLDWLASRRITPDDALCLGVSINRGDHTPDKRIMLVAIRAAENARDA